MGMTHPAGDKCSTLKRFQGDGGQVHLTSPKSPNVPVASDTSSFTRRKVGKEMLDEDNFHFLFSLVFSAANWV